ncbi:hypothetical protein HPB48_013453 [Haemaphysalis longicornis]|uniref:Uncharacterized protein n=1 Tax=Haemaphysalis longicornis TaxID=44386 RepID=A0A9J6GFS7_HAELO|nr:hypothetical protein HPB48_013453 [Haemaphysalis longicornis]
MKQPPAQELPVHRNENFWFSKGACRSFLHTAVPAARAAHSAGSAHKFTVTGTQLEVMSLCSVAESTTRESQQSAGGNPAGNLLLASGMFFAGCLAAPVLRLLASINMQIFTERTFYNYQRAYLVPAVKRLINDAAGTEVELAGEGLCDSPGFSATYMTYSVMATEVGRIILSVQIRVGESSAVPTSVSMEKEGLKRCLEKLDGSGVMVQSLTTASRAFSALKGIVESPSLLRDLTQIAPAAQTSPESFHNVLIHFAPKSNAFTQGVMKARTRLAVLHFNKNAAREQAETQDGIKRYKIKSSKSRKGHYTACPVKKDRSYRYVAELMMNAVQRCESQSYRTSRESTKSLASEQEAANCSWPPSKDEARERKAQLVHSSFKKTGLSNALYAPEDHLLWDDDKESEANEATTSNVGTDSE